MLFLIKQGTRGSIFLSRLATQKNTNPVVAYGATIRGHRYSEVTLIAETLNLLLLLVQHVGQDIEFAIANS